MKGLKIKIQALLLCGVLITGLFSSCASDENIDNGNKVNAGDKVLTLTLNTPKATTTSGAKTRVTNMTANTTEDQINRLTIGIFDAAGTTVRTIQELSSNPTIGTTGTFFTDGTKKETTATLVTNSLADGDMVLVAVNAPTTTFNGCTKASDFEDKTIAIDAALATDDKKNIGTAEAKNNIPMYGSGNIIKPATGSTTYTANVNVNHQLAKITLSDLAVAFDPNGPYKNAIFTPTSFFLINVPEDLKFNSDAWSGSTIIYHGNDDKATTYKEYLGTGSVTVSPLQVAASKTSSVTLNKFFYTMPNSDVANNTKLVICGTFDSDGDGTPDPGNTFDSNGDGTPDTNPVYYPVNINWVYDTATKKSGPADKAVGIIAKQVSPNKNYICNVKIKTKGAASPTATIDPEDVSVTVKVASFDNVSQETVFE